MSESQFPRYRLPTVLCGVPKLRQVHKRRVNMGPIYIAVVLRLLFGTRIGQILVIAFGGALIYAGFAQSWPMTISRLVCIAITLYAAWRLVRRK